MVNNRTTFVNLLNWAVVSESNSTLVQALKATRQRVSRRSAAKYLSAEHQRSPEHFSSLAASIEVDLPSVCNRPRRDDDSWLGCRSIVGISVRNAKSSHICSSSLLVSCGVRWMINTSCKDPALSSLSQIMVFSRYNFSPICFIRPRTHCTSRSLAQLADLSDPQNPALLFQPSPSLQSSSPSLQTQSHFD